MMCHEFFFKILRIYSDIWVRRHCRVIVSGLENLESVQNRRRVYIGPHPTTYDVPLLIHTAKRNLYFIIAEGPFVHPIVGRIFKGAGFVKLNYDKPRQAIREAKELVESGKPMICSMYGYGVDFGEEVGPETGAIRIAHHAKADIVPLHVMIEEDKRTFKYYKDSKGDIYPYTIFSDTLYFLSFCKPIRYEDYAKDLDTLSIKKRNAVYNKMAVEFDTLFKDMDKDLQKELKQNESYYQSLKKTGGSPIRVDW